MGHGIADPAVTLRQALLDWLRARVDEDLAVTPQVLWHYTSAEGLRGIIESGRVWASQASFLNDAREMSYGLELFFEVLGERDLSHLQPPAQAWIAKWASGEPGTVLQQWLRENAVPFVACFCAHGDLLSQWRGYGPGGGYAIGFADHPPQAWVQSAGHGLQLRRVVYDPVEQRAHIADVIERLIAALDRAPDTAEAQTAFVNNLTDAAAHVAAHCKDPAFAEEQEWRIIYQRLEDATRLDLKHRSAGNVLVPYVELPLAAAVGADAGKLPITEVRVGPNVDVTLGTLGAASLLRAAGFDVPVTPSAAPLRLR